jgi:hypothetical protein
VQISGSGTFKLGDFVEIRVSGFSFSTDGTEPRTFSGATVFLGTGPAFLDDGSVNPNAVGVYLTGVSGSYYKNGAVTALSATGNLAVVGVDGLVLTGTAVQVLYNTDTTARLGVPAATSTTQPYAKVVGTVTLQVAGQSLSGTMAFTRAGADTVIELGSATGVQGASAVVLSLGDPPSNGAAAPLVVTIASATLTLTPTGLYGGFTVTVASTVPGMVVDGATISLRVNTTDVVRTVLGASAPAGSVRLVLDATGTGQGITLGGQQLTGVFGFEQVRGPVSPSAPPGTVAPRLVRVFVDRAGLVLGTASSGVTLTGGTGLLVLGVGGLAGRLTGTVSVRVAGTTPFSGTFTVALNNGTTAVRESVTTPGGTVSLDLPGGPYVRVEGIGVRLALQGQVLTGDFLFERATVGGTPVVRVAARNVSGSFGDGVTPYVTVTGGSGLLLLDAAGLAGFLTGTVAVTVPDVALSGTFTVAVNSSGTGIDGVEVGFGLQPGTTQSVVIGDVNGDGRPDLLLGTLAGVLLYLNDGSGDPFDTLPAFLLGTAVAAQALALADVDGDGDLDVVVGRVGATVLLRNDGAGRFAEVAVALGSGARSIGVGQVVGSAAVDVVVAAGNKVVVYENRGFVDTSDQTQQTWQGFTSGVDVTGLADDATRSLALGDVDRDGRLDLVLTGTTDTLHLGDGAGGFAAGTLLPTTGSRSVVLADVDGDGWLDLLRTRAGVAGFEVVRNKGSPVTTVTTQLAVSDQSRQLSVGSTAGFPPTGTLRVTFGSTTLDIAYTATTATTFTIPGQSVVIPDGAVVTVAWQGFQAPAAAIGTQVLTGGLAVGDLDGDGRADAVVSTGTGSAKRLSGTGAGAFGAPVAVGALVLTVPAGPYLKVTGTGITLTVAGVTLTGGFSFAQQTVGGAQVVTVTLDGVTLALGGGFPPVSLTGSLVLSGGALAAELVVTLGAGSFGAGVSIVGTPTATLRINTGPGVVVLPGTGTRLPAGPYVRVLVEGLDLEFGAGGPRLTASVSIESATNSLGERRTVVAVTGGSLSMSGASVLTGVTGLLVLSPGGLAGRLGGTVDASALLPAGVTLSGTFSLAVNRTASRVVESVTVGGSTVSMDLPAGPYLRVAGDDVRLSVLGQVLSGSIALEQSGTMTTLVLSGITVRLGDGSTDLVTLTNGEGALVVREVSGARVLSGALSADVTVNVPGVSLTGTFGLRLNTGPTTAASTVPVVVAGTTRQIAVGGEQRLEIGGTGLVLSVAGQTLTGTFWISQTGTGPSRRTEISVPTATLFLGDASGSTPRGITVTVTGGSALLTSGGVALAVQVTVALTGLGALPVQLGADPLAPSVSGALRLNTLPTAVTLPNGVALPAGRFVRVELGTSSSPFTIGAFGQTLSGVFAFEQVTTSGPDGVLGTTDDRAVLRIAATGVALHVGPDAGTGFSLTGGSALLLLTPDGMAGRISGTATLRAQGIDEVTATVTVELNDLRRTDTATGRVLPIAVDETFDVGGTRTRLAIAAGPLVRVSVTGLVLSIAGQRLTADVVLERALTGLGADASLGGTDDTYAVRLRLSGVSLRIGSGARDVVLVSGASGSFELTSGVPGLVGTLRGTVAVDVPGVVVSGTFEVSVDTRGTTRTFTVSGTGVTLSVAGQQLVGGFTVVKQTDGTLRLTLQGVTLQLGNGTTTFLTVTIAAGSFIEVLPTGVTGSLSATVTPSPQLLDVLTLSGLTATVAFSTVPGTGSPYLRVQLGTAGAPVSISVMGQSVRAVLSFEQVTTSGGVKLVKAALTHVDLDLGAPSAGVQVRGASASLLITPNGVAGTFSSGTITLTGALATHVRITGTLTVQVNTLGVAVDETVGGSRLQLQAGPYFRLLASGSISLGPVETALTLSGTVAIDRIGPAGSERTRLAFTDVSVSSGADLGGGRDNPGLKQASGALVLYTDANPGLAGFLVGRVATGSSGFAADLSVGFEINTTAVARTEDIPVGTSRSPSACPPGRAGSPSCCRTSTSTSATCSRSGAASASPPARSPAPGSRCSSDEARPP